LSERPVATPSTASRADVLGRSALALAMLAAGGIWMAGAAGPAGSAPSRAQDRRIFNFALALEYLQAAFYANALERGALGGELLEFAEVVGEQERRHVAYLRESLGEAAIEEPAYDFADLAADSARFGSAAFDLEESGVGAYVGQASNLTEAGVAAAAPIISVEARHAAWIRDLIGRNPAPRPADPARTAAQVQTRLERAGFQLPALEG